MLEGIKDKDHFWNLLKYSGLFEHRISFGVKNTMT